MEDNIAAVELMIESYGGSAPRRTVHDKLKEHFPCAITGLRGRPLLAGTPEWIRRVDQVRREMCKRGDLDESAPHGIWRLR